MDTRTSVRVTDKGSTLVIVYAEEEDAGEYLCEVAVQHNPRPALNHTVINCHHCDDYNVATAS